MATEISPYTVFAGSVLILPAQLFILCAAFLSIKTKQLSDFLQL